MAADRAYRDAVAKERNAILEWCRSNCGSGLWSVDLKPDAVLFCDPSAKRKFERWYMSEEACSRYNV